MRIVCAEKSDVLELYKLQLLAFESEAEMIGSRDVPALLETKEENEKDFINWNVLKLINDSGKIIGAIRYRKNDDVIEVGRLMVHPDYRHQGLAQKLISQVDLVCPNDTKELFTCKKSWINIRLYEKMGYKIFREHTEGNGLPLVYMRKM
jgi:ribosomal protein S18 acetylase RimI-like enzyme